MAAGATAVFLSAMSISASVPAPYEEQVFPVNVPSRQHYLDGTLYDYFLRHSFQSS